MIQVFARLCRNSKKFAGTQRNMKRTLKREVVSVTRSNQIRKRLLKHKLRTPQIFFEHTVFSLKFPAYIAVHKLAVTNSTKHVTHPTHFPTKNESVLNTTKLFIRVLGNYTVNVA